MLHFGDFVSPTWSTYGSATFCHDCVVHRSPHSNSLPVVASHQVGDLQTETNTQKTELLGMHAF